MGTNENFLNKHKNWYLRLSLGPEFEPGEKKSGLEAESQANKKKLEYCCVVE